MSTPNKPKSHELILSTRDSAFLDPKTSPLLKSDQEMKGFIPTDFWESMAFRRDPTDKTLLEDSNFKIIEQNFNRFSTFRIKSPPSDYSQPPQKSTIPALIHFIWLGQPMPQDFMTLLETWRKCHSGWKIKIWNEEDIKSFVWSDGYIKWAFEDARSFAEKTDILRYEILYQFGGIYSDIDVLCFKSFNDLISTEFDFFCGLEQNQPRAEYGLILYAGTTLLGAAQGHPLIKFCLENLASKTEDPTNSNVFRTGPGLLTRACQNILATSNKEKILILPCSYFYPLPFYADFMHKALTAQEMSDYFISPESMTLHLWAATWYE